MAKIKYSALVSDMRNKLNGSVLSKNRYGSYVRNKVTPVNPQTSFQQAVRQRLGSLSASWRGLSQVARDGFSELAKSVPFTDIFGDSKTLDGKSFFVKLNSNLLSVGQAPILVAPIMGQIPELSIVSGGADASGAVTITLGQEELPVGYALKVYSTPALPAQINFVKNRMRELAGAQTIEAGDVILTAAYSARFGALSDADEGKRIFIRAVVVDTTTGQQGVPVEIILTVDAG